MSGLLVVGDLMVDVVAVHRDPIATGSDTAARISLRGGGSAANAACWAAHLAASTATDVGPVRLLAARGDDELGHLACSSLERAGVVLVGPVPAGSATGTCIVLVDPTGERTMLPDRGANDRLDPAAVAAAFADPPDHLHLSGYALLHEGSRRAGQAALAAGIAAGATVSVDAASTAPIRAVGAETFLGWVEGASLLFANDDELAVLGGVDAVLRRVGAVAVKHGAAGATWTDGRTTASSDGLAVEVVDTTGAGDAFAAGWIVASAAGATPEGALGAAVRAGAAAVTLVGARPPLPGRR